MSGARARILGRTGEFAGVTHEFGEAVSVGRTAGNDIVLSSPFLSGRHARIFVKDGEHWIEDLGSRNGTRVDGVAVTSPARLERVHVITLADVIDLLYVRAATDAVSVPPRREPVESLPAPAAVPDHVEARPVAASSMPDSPATPAHSPGQIVHTLYDLGFDPLVDPRSTGAPQRPVAPPPAFDLVLARPDGERQVFELRAGDNVLGRADDCEVTLADPEKWLSRHHATLNVQPDAVWLTDHQTVNGTFVSGQRIESVRLEPGTSFRLGPYVELMLVRR